MDNEFWHRVWEDESIGFHLNQANPALLRHWSAFGLAPGSTVLVPLCGKTRDIPWLLEQGYQVVGIELSEKALSQLADELQQQAGIPVRRASGIAAGVCFQGAGVVLIAADLFELAPTDLPLIHAVYDRAALVALPESKQAAYVRKTEQLAPGCPQLLISLDYDASAMGGPPFSVDPARVQSLYAARFRIELLERRDLIESEPRFRERGLDHFVQTVYRLAPLPDARSDLSPSDYAD